MAQQRIVCTGDDASGLEIRCLVLESFGYQVRLLPSCAAASGAIAAERVKLVILDYSELNQAQIKCIRSLRVAHPAQLILLIAPMFYVNSDVSALVDCVLLKGATPEEFRQAVQSCIGSDRTGPMLALAIFVGAVIGTARLLLKRRKSASISDVRRPALVP